MKLHIRKKMFAFILLSGSLCLLVSCAKNLNMTVKSNDELNNGGNPVVVRIYLLKTDVNFQRSTLEAFWKNDRESLGSDLVEEPIEIMLHPGETRKMKKIKLNKEINYVGAAADFYQPDKNQWKYLFNISQSKADELILAVGRDKLMIAEPEG